MKEITNIQNLVNEYLKCKNSFSYFCQNYITMTDKIEKLCKRCDNYEHCNEIQYY